MSDETPSKPTPPDVTGIETIYNSVAPFLSRWIKRKNNTIVQAATLTAALGQAGGLWDLSPTTLVSIMAAAASYWLAIGAMTVTANVRLTGKAWGHPDGITVDDVVNSNKNLVVLPGTDPTEEGTD